MIFLALIYLAFISLGLPDSLLGSAWPIMNAEFGVPVGNAGFVSILISGCTIISSLFSHRLIRRFGTGRVMVASVAMTALALLGFSLAPSFSWLPVFAVPLGLGAGAVDAGLNEFVAEHYEAKHMNWLHCFWGVGAMLGPALLSALVQSGRAWRSGYFSIAMIQFALVALLFFSLPMWRKRERPALLPAKAGKAIRDKKGLLAPMHARGATFALLTFFLYSSAEGSMTLWAASFLVKMKSVSPESAAGWVSLFFLGITAGRMIGGFASMKIRNAAMIRLGALLALFGFGLMLLPLPAPFAIAALCLTGLGLAPIFPSMLHQTPLNFGQEHAQAAMGLQMAAAYTGSTFMAPLFGQLFDRVSFALMPGVLLACLALLFICTERLTLISERGPA